MVLGQALGNISEKAGFPGFIEIEILTSTTNPGDS
jgi:hypothetical protein